MQFGMQFGMHIVTLGKFEVALTTRRIAAVD